VQHVLKLSVIAGKVEHCTTNREVGKAGGKRYGLDRLHSKVLRRQVRRQHCRHTAEVGHAAGIQIHAKHLVSLAQEIDQVPAGATARIQNPHTRNDAASQQLIEEVDVDVTELLAKVGRGH
jgi:hypothetical protein